jgi:hypothetical protein
MANVSGLRWFLAERGSRVLGAAPGLADRRRQHRADRGLAAAPAGLHRPGGGFGTLYAAARSVLPITEGAGSPVRPTGLVLRPADRRPRKPFAASTASRATSSFATIRAVSPMRCST